MIDLFSKKNKILKFIENGDSENLSSILNKISDINEKFSRPGLCTANHGIRRIRITKNGLSENQFADSRRER